MTANLLQHIIEGILMAGAGLGSIGTRISIKRMTTISVLYGFMVHFVRNFYISNNIAMGTHTIVIMIGFAIIIKVFGKQKMLNSIIASILSISLILLSEMILVYPIVSFIKNTGYKEFTYLSGWILSHTIITIIFIFTYILRKTIINFEYFKL